MRKNKRKFLYLISPNKIQKKFYKDLASIFKFNNISVFQLRLKKYSYENKVIIGKKVKQICKKFRVKFIINDDVFLAKKLGADGCHLGQSDMKLDKARRILGKKIVGIT